MGDRLTHECGLALLRLKRPLSWFQSELGDPLWGLRQLYLLMEKQHNRGQDGAGIAMAKFDMPPGELFIDRLRSAKRSPLERIFGEVMKPANALSAEDLRRLHPTELKHRIPMLGEVMMGHLRYGTFAGHGPNLCHPYLRTSNVASRNLALAGNFNLTNSRELFEHLVSLGLNPVGEADTGVMLEKIGHFLDEEHRFLAGTMGPGSLRNLEGHELAARISAELNLVRVLRRATQDCDGGFVLMGILGNGDCFAVRDPHGIRPAFYVETDHAVAVASERPALVTVLGVKPDAVKPVPPGHALVVKASGEFTIERYAEPVEERQCTFERIYFSRGNDPAIYRERKALGEQLAQRVLESVEWKIDSTVVGFIPNTSETAFLGLLQRMETLVAERSGERLWKLFQSGKATREDVMHLIHPRIRAEKVATKDQKLRTFITHDAARRELVNHVYDITRDTVKPGDTLVVIDDSIVRGTTLRESIITMLSRLDPARIVVVSSAPPIMYPDCYGIDMSQLGRFIAFEAAVGLHHDRGTQAVLDEVEAKCIEQQPLKPERMQNHVKAIYDAFTLEQLSAKIAQLVRAPNLAWQGRIDVLYQSIEGLHAAMPGYSGDWYFTGRYPTPGGYKVLNTAYLNWRRKDEGRAY